MGGSIRAVRDSPGPDGEQGVARGARRVRPWGRAHPWMPVPGLSVLRDARPYQDPEADYEQLMVRRNAPRWIHMLHRYGLLEHRSAATTGA